MQNNNCILCKHYRFNLECDAFPEGIPTEVVTWEFPHLFRHPEQDNDILFDPLEDSDGEEETT